MVELFVVIAIIGLLLAVMLTSVKKIRATGERIRCSNQLRQLALALHGCHDEHGHAPPGIVANKNDKDFPYMTWLTRILPYVEQDTVWQRALVDYRKQRNPFFPKTHPNLAVVVTLFTCPADPRGPGPHPTHRNRTVGVTSYIGVLGIDHTTNDGVLYKASATRFGDIRDGTANTLLLGERPPAGDFWYGWWYAGVGMAGSGSPDSLLGVRETRTRASFTNSCGPGPYHFRPARFDDTCAVFHFWSPHPGGANFAMCDGSVHFLAYSADAILPALATRAGGEAVEVP